MTDPVTINDLSTIGIVLLLFINGLHPWNALQVPLGEAETDKRPLHRLVLHLNAKPDRPLPALLIGLPLIVVMLLVVASKFIGEFVYAKVFLRIRTSTSAYLFDSWLVPRRNSRLSSGNPHSRWEIVEEG